MTAGYHQEYINTQKFPPKGYSLAIASGSANFN